jgi:hypothetical protein
MLSDSFKGSINTYILSLSATSIRFWHKMAIFCPPIIICHVGLAHQNTLKHYRLKTPDYTKLMKKKINKRKNSSSPAPPWQDMYWSRFNFHGILGNLRSKFYMEKLGNLERDFINIPSFSVFFFAGISFVPSRVLCLPCRNISPKS